MLSFRIAYAVCIGSGHIQEALPCQDVVMSEKQDDFCVAVLADGAGSCKYALEGAQTVAKTVLALLNAERDFWLDASEPAIRHAVIASCIRALEENEHQIEEQASTLLFACIRKDGAFLCGHIGDGYIFHISGEETVLLSDAENGVCPNETVFVTSPHAEAHLRVSRGRLHAGDSIVLCSDGAGESLYARMDQLCAPAVAIIGRWMETHTEEEVSAALLQNMDMRFREASADDMSISVLHCVADGEDGDRTDSCEDSTQGADEEKERGK